VKTLKGASLICDIGAHIGLFTLRISREYQSSKIIAIEPNPEKFHSTC